jgi:hypothetical protein
MIKRAMRAIASAVEFSNDHAEESCKTGRRSFADAEEPVFNAACETYRKPTPRTLKFTKDDLEKTLTWMTLGAKNPVTVKYEDLAAAVKY